MISEDERIANGKPCPITNLYSQKPRLSRFTKIYQELFTVDYVTSPDRWYIETPFSVINWRQIELMSLLSRLSDLTAQESLLELPFTPEIAQTISLNVLPDCQTVMHLITRNYDFMRYFCQSLQDSSDPSEFFAVPFIENLYGKTALHNSLFGDNMTNPRVTEFFFKQLLPGMPLDHHGRAIADCIPMCIDRGVQGLGEYMDSRFISTKQLQKVSRLDKKAIKKSYETQDEQYYVTRCDLWPDERLLTKRIYDDNKQSAEIEVKILDLPKLHDANDPVAQDFAEALAGLEETNILRFMSVRSIINFRWPLIKRYVLLKQLLPYSAFFLCYLAYVLYLFDYEVELDDEAESQALEYMVDVDDINTKPLWFSVIDGILLGVLTIFSIYFLL